MRNEEMKGKDVTERTQQDESVTTMNRRGFLKTAGAGAAVAGTTLTVGCRKPVQYILPYGQRPEDVIPGKPVYYATGFHIGSQVHAVTVESHDGRPTKIEGNEIHPLSLGKTSSWAQSSILDLYNPDRSQTPTLQGEAKTLEDA